MAKNQNGNKTDDGLKEYEVVVTYSSKYGYDGTPKTEKVRAKTEDDAFNLVLKAYKEKGIPEIFSPERHPQN